MLFQKIVACRHATYDQVCLNDFHHDFTRGFFILPDESCRKCGGLLVEYTVCAKCRTANQFICRLCGTKTLIKYHDSICFKPELRKTLLSMNNGMPQDEHYRLIIFPITQYYDHLARLQSLQ